MSRIRSVHPGLWTDEAFVTLTPVARLFFIGLWNECDDRGIFQWSPLQLKMRILPLEGAQPEKLLMELVEAGFVLSYMIGGKQFGAVKNFTKYQHPKKPRYIYLVTDDVAHFVSDGEAVPNEFPTGGEVVPIGEEGRGGEGKEEEIDSSSGDDAILTIEEVVEDWNTMASAIGLATVRKITETRRRQFKARLADYPELEEWQRAFRHIRNTPFLRGENKTSWRADFDFLLQAKSFTKLTEEAYGQAD